MSTPLIVDSLSVYQRMQHNDWHASLVLSVVGVCVALIYVAYVAYKAYGYPQKSAEAWKNTQVFSLLGLTAGLGLHLVASAWVCAAALASMWAWTRSGVLAPVGQGFFELQLTLKPWEVWNVLLLERSLQGAEAILAYAYLQWGVVAVLAWALMHVSAMLVQSKSKKKADLLLDKVAKSNTPAPPSRKSKFVQYRR